MYRPLAALLLGALLTLPPVAAAEAGGTVLGGRPPGCPHAFCACGASLEVFGRIIPALNLAASWFRFPRAEPAPGRVAVRRHHVFVLEEHVQGDLWVVKDYNSGHHQTRRHQRSLRGFVVVEPRGTALM